jgi:hypothetical protein
MRSFRYGGPSQKSEYVYDAEQRLTQVKRYPVSTGAEDLCQKNHAHLRDQHAVERSAGFGKLGRRGLRGRLHLHRRLHLQRRRLGLDQIADGRQQRLGQIWPVLPFALLQPSAYRAVVSADAR